MIHFGEFSVLVILNFNILYLLDHVGNTRRGRLKCIIYIRSLKPIRNGDVGSVNVFQY